MGTRNLPPRAWVFGNESDSSLQDLSLYSILSDIDLTESLQKPTEADKELQVEADSQAGIDESEEVGENKEGFPEDKTEDVDSLHQITFTSPAVPSVLSAQDLIDFHTVQVEKGEGESVESLKSAAVESYLDTVRSLNKVNKRVSFGGVEERQIRNDSPDEGEKIEEGNLFENPLYESLTECLSGLVGQYDEPLNLPVYHNEQPEHLYQNNEPVYQNEHLHEHLYENEIFGDAESSTDEPIYENIEFHNEVSNCQPPSPTKADTNPFRTYNGSVEEEQSSISSTPSSLTPPQNPSPPPLNPFLPTETREDPEGKEGDSPHYSPRASLQMATSGVEFEKSLLKLNPTTGKPSAAAPLEEELQETGDDDLLAQGFKKTQIIEIFDDGSWDSKEMPEELNGVEEVSVAAATNYSVSAATAETPTVVRTDGVYMAACVTITDMNDNNQTSDAVAEVTSTIPPPPPPPVQPLQKVEPIFSAKPATVVEEIPQKQKNLIKAPQRKKKSGHKKEAKKSSTEKPTNTPESVEKMVEDIEKERKKLIGEQVIRAKKMESWLKSDKKQTVVQDVDAKTLESKKKYEARKKQKEKENVQVEGENSGKTHQKRGKKGEVNLDSIIKHKDATKSFWETKMLAAVTKPEEEEEVPKTNGYHSVEDAIQPPPQFNSSNASDGNSSDEELGGGGKALTKYIYGDRGELIEKSISTRKEAVIVEAQKPASQENIIEQEIREQQLREAHMRNEIMLKDEEDRSDEEDLQESVIEREIRLQRERERKLSQEREEARRAAIDRTGLAMIEPLSNGYTSQSSPSPPPSDSGDFPASAEARIALEIRELKAREEELRRARDRELGVEEAPVSITASTTTDEGNYSECGHDDSGSSRLTSPEVPTVSSHQRTQSLDSISSGHSSSGTAHSYAEFVSKRKVTVRPLAEPEDEEETPAYRRVLGETAVEREIRVSMEREEELKKMRKNSLTSTPIKKELSRRPSTGKLDSAPDSRDVPHRLATLSIRRELWEQSEREQSLRQEGTIRTTSEDYVDAKVTRLSDLVEMSKEQINEQTMKMVGATPPTTPSPQPQFTRTPVFRKASAPSSLTNGHSPVQVTPVRVSTSVAPTRGIMQKFIANRGKIPAISAFNAAPSGTSTLPPRVPPVNNSVSPPVTSSATLKPTPAKKFEKNKTSSRTVRRYSTAEEKIHQELKDMKQREQELRYHRKQVLARSQPDLLAALNDEQIPEVEETDEEVCLPSLKPLRDRAMSNPNLLDEVECDSVKPAVRAAAPRRNPLIAKWESRIQQNIES